MLPRVTFIDGIHSEDIKPLIDEEEDEAESIDEHFGYQEKFFILSKFVKFDHILDIEECQKLANEAISHMAEEDDELMIIKNHVRRPERKNEAFEKETFDIFED